MRLMVRLVVRLHYAHARLIDVRPGLKSRERAQVRKYGTDRKWGGNNGIARNWQAHRFHVKKHVYTRQCCQGGVPVKAVQKIVIPRSCLSHCLKWSSPMRLVVRLVVRLHYAHARLIHVRPGLTVPRERAQVRKHGTDRKWGGNNGIARNWQAHQFHVKKHVYTRQCCQAGRTGKSCSENRAPKRMPQPLSEMELPDAPRGAPCGAHSLRPCSAHSCASGLKSPESGHRSGNMALTANGAATTALRAIGKLTGSM